MSINNEGNFASIDIAEQTGSTFGMDFSGCFNYMIASKISVGARLGVMLGTLGKIKQTIPGLGTETIKLSDDDKESLSRLDISIGLRFYL